MAAPPPRLTAVGAAAGALPPLRLLRPPVVGVALAMEASSDAEGDAPILKEAAADEEVVAAARSMLEGANMKHAAPGRSGATGAPPARGGGGPLLDALGAEIFDMRALIGTPRAPHRAPSGKRAVAMANGATPVKDAGAAFAASPKPSPARVRDTIRARGARASKSAAGSTHAPQADAEEIDGDSDDDFEMPDDPMAAIEEQLEAWDKENALEPSAVTELRTAVLGGAKSGALAKAPEAMLQELVKLLDWHVKRAADGKFVLEEEATELDEELDAGLDACRGLLAVLGLPELPRKCFVEEAIEHAVALVREQVHNSVLPLYDDAVAVLKGRAKGKTPEKVRTPKSARKGTAAKAASRVAAKLVAKTAECVGGLSGVLDAPGPYSRRPPDAAMLPLTVSCCTLIASASVPATLHRQCAEYIAAFFGSYERHREVVLDELASVVPKLPAKGKSMRTFILQGEGGKVVQATAAALMMCVQRAARLPLESSIAADAGARAAKTATPGRAPGAVEAMWLAVCKSADTFWSRLFKHMRPYTSAKKQADIDVRPLMVNLLTDLLDCRAMPEWPSAALLVQVLCQHLLKEHGLESKEPTARYMAYGSLGQIVATLKEDKQRADELAESESLFSATLTLGQTEDDTGAPWEPARAREATWQSAGKAPGEGEESGDAGVCTALIERAMARASTALRFSAGAAALDAADGGDTDMDDISDDSDNEGATRRSSKKAGGQTTAKDRRMAPEEEGQLRADVVCQQVALDYLGQRKCASSSRSTHGHAMRVAQWYFLAAKQLPPDAAVSKHERLLRFARTRGVGSGQFESAAVGAPVAASAAREMAKSAIVCLSQSSGLARTVPVLSDRLLGALKAESASNCRARALKALAHIAQSDPAFMSFPAVRSVVHARAGDESALVREAAVDLVGRHATSRGQADDETLVLLHRRAVDTAVSVRKRAILAMRDVVTAGTGGFGGVASDCKAILRVLSRANDEEHSIRVAVVQTVTDLWLARPAGESCDADEDLTRLQVFRKRADQLVECVKADRRVGVVMADVLRRALTLGSASTDEATAAAATAEKKRLAALFAHRAARTLTACILERILESDESAEGANDAAGPLPYAAALRVLAAASPELVSPPDDRLRVVATLRPHLAIRASSDRAAKAADAERVEHLLAVVARALPLSPAVDAGFAEGLASELVGLARVSLSKGILRECARTLGALADKSRVASAKTAGLAQVAFTALRSLAERLGKTAPGVGQSTSDEVLAQRSLFLAGLLCRYADVHVDSASVDGDKTRVSIKNLHSLYIKFLRRSPSTIVKRAAMEGIGLVFISRPEVMLEDNMLKMMSAAMVPGSGVDPNIRMQALANLSDFLTEEEQRMAALGEAGSSAPDGALQKSAGEGDTGAASQVVQKLWPRVLAIMTDGRDHVGEDEHRGAALRIAEQAARQGLVHPLSVIAQLIALHGDASAPVAATAHRQLKAYMEGHPDFVETRLGDGLRLMYELYSATGIEAVAPSGPQGCTPVAAAAVARVYRLVSPGGRVARHVFLRTALRPFKFAVGSEGEPSTGRVRRGTSKDVGEGAAVIETPAVLAHLAGVLATLPYTTVDELFFVTHVIDDIVAARGNSVMDALKRSLAGAGRSQDGAGPSPETQRNAEAAYAASVLLALKSHLARAYRLRADRRAEYNPRARMSAEAAKRDARVGALQLPPVDAAAAALALATGRECTAGDAALALATLKAALAKDTEEEIAGTAPGLASPNGKEGGDADDAMASTPSGVAGGASSGKRKATAPAEAVTGAKSSGKKGRGAAAGKAGGSTGRRSQSKRRRGGDESDDDDDDDYACDDDSDFEGVPAGAASIEPVRSRPARGSRGSARRRL